MSFGALKACSTAILWKVLCIDPGHHDSFFDFILLYFLLVVCFVMYFFVCIFLASRCLLLPGAIRLVRASSMPHYYAAATAKVSRIAHESFESRMQAALGYENDSSRVNPLSTVIPTG